jgi:hypothetical protein
MAAASASPAAAGADSWVAAVIAEEARSGVVDEERCRTEPCGCATRRSLGVGAQRRGRELVLAQDPSVEHEHLSPSSGC